MTKKAFTLLELLVVVLILSLLATIAVGVFTTQVARARVAATQATIASLELAIERYQIDLGEFPPSGSGLLPFPTSRTFEGCGYLQLALTSSLSGKSTVPGSSRWQGPYINVKNVILGDITGIRIDDPARTVAVAPGAVQILDPYGQPYRYLRSKSVSNPNSTTELDQYSNNGGTVIDATKNGYAATETYYNPSTFQIVSKGSDGVTLANPNYGSATDDITNFGM